MKKYKLRTVLLSILFLTVSLGYSQTKEITLKNASNGGKIKINELGAEFEIKIHKSDKLKIVAESLEKKPKRADGLKSLYYGNEDNTGIGLSVIQTDKYVEISAASKQSHDAEYIFYIPENFNIDIIQNSYRHSEDIVLKNITTELNIKTQTSDVMLDNVTGPVVISTLSGDIEVKFSTVSQKSPMSIKSVSGDLDITMPENTKANLDIGTISGDVYTDFEIKIGKKGDMRQIGGSEFKYKLNGGGVVLDLSSVSGDVYLRKKK